MRTMLSVASVMLAGVVVVVGVPAVTGATWRDIGARLTSLSPLVLAALTVLWLAGLGAYAVVLAASLPGLGRFRAFTLNAVGSAASNLLPFGGAAGVAVTFALAARWGLQPAAVMISGLVTGVWNVAASLAAPVLALVLVAATGRDVAGPGIGVALTAAVLLAGLLLAVLALRRDSPRARLGALADGLARRLRRPLPRGQIAELRTATRDLVRGTWMTLSAGMLAYLALQAALFMACSAAADVAVDPVAGFLAFSVGRMLTLVVVTPGGAGISETGTAALLVAYGAAPGPAGAGALLFATFVFLLEIPLGALLWFSTGPRRCLRHRSR